MTRFEEIRDLIMRYVKHYRIQVIAGSVIALLGIMLALFFSTKEEAVQVTSGLVKVENTEYLIESQNPLARNKYEDVDAVVKKYYEGLAENSEFVDSYDDMIVYTKFGRYEGTYIAFVYYQMNIPGIYTKVPGLETLFVYEDYEQSLCISTEIQSEQQQEEVSAVVTHEDVQALFAQVENEFQQAVASDAMLEQALSDLQAAYKEHMN